MKERISVLDIYVDDCSPKEALKCVIGFQKKGPVSIVETVTASNLMLLSNQDHLKEDIREFDMVLAGDPAILNTTTEFRKTSEHDVEQYTFLKLLLHYLHKNKKRLYLLVEDQEESHEILGFLDRHYKGILVAGMAKVVSKDRSDDMIVNAINGADADCVLSMLSTPLQEDFIIKNKKLLNVNLWVGVGKNIFPYIKTLPMKERISKYIICKIFQKMVKEEK